MSSNPHSTSRTSSQPEDFYNQEESFQQDGGHPPSMEPRPIARQPVHEVDRIGDILRRVREHRGEDLESISDYLRIRPAYLIALENSRYDDLPADAYVIGFLRTYALYLGLDGKGAIDQYRREMAGRRRKPQLTMPQPMAEGRAPTAAVMIGAAIAALLVYSIWYGLSSPDSSAPEKLPAATTLPLVKETTPATPTTDNSATDPSLAAQTATSDGIALSVPVSDVATTTATAEPKESTKPDAAPSEPDNTLAGEAKTELPKEEAKEPPKYQPASEKAKKEKTESKLESAASTPAEPPKTESQPPAPAVYGEKGKSRLSVKADKESWVLITDSKGNTVFEKTLKPGETYNVPMTKGLKLTTGNANGVTVSLDGATLPKMSSTETVARAIPLDPDKIKANLTEGSSTAGE